MLTILDLPHSVAWWYFSGAVSLANTSMGIVISLTDSLVMCEVTKTGVTYGSIRLWGTLGWGVLGLFAGYLNDGMVLSTLPYLLPGLVMFIVVAALDVLLISHFLQRAATPVPVAVLKESEIFSTALNPTESPLHATISRTSTLIRSQRKPPPASIWQQVARTFVAFPHLYQYCFTIVAIGVLTAFHWSFFFWFLEEIQGKDTLLMGLTLVVQCFLGELPFFLISDTIVRRLGPSNALCVTLAAFSARYLCYGYLIKPGYAYYVLVVELTQGPTFGLFYCVMTSIAQEHALHAARKTPPSSTPRQDDDHDKAINGRPADKAMTTSYHSNASCEDDDPREQTHATMQGLLSACYEGLGLGIGALIAGVTIDAVGLSWTWRVAGYLSLVIMAASVLLRWMITRHTRRADAQEDRS